MIRPVFCCLWVLLSACQPAPKSEGAPVSASPPNILWIVADDLGPDLGCYGVKAVHTPHLDQLAREGVRFEHLHTTTAVCSPSRSGLITGMYPVSIGCHQHRTQYKDSLPAPVKPVTALFRDAGYWVSNASQKNLDRYGKTDYNFIHEAEALFDSPNWRGRAPGQPFFAQVQIFYPHRPFVRDTLHPVDPEAVNIPPYYPDQPLTRADWAWYLETVQQVDKAVGELMATLKEEGLLENTVVMFFGDQGRPHVRAKQFLYDPGTHTPLIVRWPGGQGAGTTDDRLVSNIDLAAASLTLAGIELPAWMQGQDFLGAGALPRAELFTMRDRRDETVDRIRALRTQRFKYIRNFYPERPWNQFNAYKKYRYPVLTLMEVMHEKGQLNPEQARFFAPQRPAEELYDLQADPFEVHSLAAVPAYADTLALLRQRLNTWLAQTDRGTYPEAPEEIAYAEQLMEDRFQQNMAREGLAADLSDEAFLQWWKEQLGIVEK